MMVRKKTIKSIKIKMFQYCLTDVFPFIRVKMIFSVYVYFFYGFCLKTNNFEITEM